MEKISLITLKLFGILLLLSSCTSQLMNRQSYSQITIGMSTKQAQLIAGEPYRITQEEDYQNYEYIERFEIGPRTINQNTYILAVREGIVIDKQMRNHTPSVNFSTP